MNSLWPFIFSILFFLGSGDVNGQDNSDNADRKHAMAQKEVFTIVEEQPTYEGGLDDFYNLIRNDIRYPLQARKSGIEGEVRVQFVVDRNGSIVHPEVTKGIGGGCDQQALRVLNNAASFRPGKQRGRTVSVKMELPIEFTINKKKNNPDGSPQGSIVVQELQILKNSHHVEADYANGQWSGTIFSDEGDHLPGANIVVDGTANGTVSDLDGTFQLKADPRSEIFISFVGYETTEIRNE